jgi:hypothetical protein
MKHLEEIKSYIQEHNAIPNHKYRYTISQHYNEFVVLVSEFNNCGVLVTEMTIEDFYNEHIITNK